MSVVRTLRGCLLCPHAEEAAVSLVPDGLIEIDEAGTIVAVGPAPLDCDEPESFPGAVLLPGFVDTHVHFPQTRVLGSASGPLLPWHRLYGGWCRSQTVSRAATEQQLCIPQSGAATEMSEELVVRLPVALVQISYERTGRCQQRFSTS